MDKKNKKQIAIIGTAHAQIEQQVWIYLYIQFWTDNRTGKEKQLGHDNVFKLASLQESILWFVSHTAISYSMMRSIEFKLQSIMYVIYFPGKSPGKYQRKSDEHRYIMQKYQLKWIQMELRRSYMSCCNQKILICNFLETKKWTLIKCGIDLIRNRTEQIPTVVTHSWFL